MVQYRNKLSRQESKWAVVGSTISAQAKLDQEQATMLMKESVLGVGKSRDNFKIASQL